MPAHETNPIYLHNAHATNPIYPIYQHNTHTCLIYNVNYWVFLFLFYTTFFLYYIFSILHFFLSNFIFRIGPKSCLFFGANTALQLPLNLAYLFLNIVKIQHLLLMPRSPLKTLLSFLPKIGPIL